MAGGIFTSYRRADSASFTGRIRDYFEYRHADIPMFFDVNSIEPGHDFDEVINERLAKSDIVLAVIGDRWLDVQDANGQRRLDDHQDTVRRELSTALAMKLRVIPILLDKADMPSVKDLPDDLKLLANRNAFFVREVSFKRDMEELSRTVCQYCLTSTKKVAVPPEYANAPAIRKNLVDAFAQFGSESADDAFMICENQAGEFVQFAKQDKGMILLDLPTHKMTEAQRLAAARILSEKHDVGIYKCGDSFTYSVSLPLEPHYLSYLTRDVFANVYGTPPDIPLTITIDH